MYEQIWPWAICNGTYDKNRNNISAVLICTYKPYITVIPGIIIYIIVISIYLGYIF